MSVTMKKSSGLGVIVIENSGKFNAMNQKMFQELEDALSYCEKDDEISVVILTGQGTIFCAGFDVSEIYELSMSNDRPLADEYVGKIRRVVERLVSSKKPSIAVIDGVCLGAGFELALACSARISSERAKFGFPEISLGLIPGLGGTQRLPRLAGAKEALEILLAGRERMLPAQKALKSGIIDAINSKGDLKKFAKDYAGSLLGGAIKFAAKSEKVDVSILDSMPKTLLAFAEGKSPEAVEAVLEAVKASRESLRKGLELEHELFLDLLFSDGARRNMRKFLKIKEEKPSRDSPVSSSGNETRKPIYDSYGSDEYMMLQIMVRDFARKSVLPQVKQMEEKGRVEPDIIRQMGELGLFGVSFPEKYGGAGMGRHGVHIIAEELSRVSPSCAVFYGAHVALACGSIFFWGSEEQKQKYLIPAFKGEKIGAFALTEPDVGSDVANIKLSAVKERQLWVLNGAKQFISNGTIADFVVVFAQTDPLGGNQTMAAFIVDMNTSGLSSLTVGEKVGLHASDTAILHFDDVKVPQENLLGRVGDGFKVAMTALNGSRLGVCAIALGEAKEAFELASQYSAARKVAGEPLYMIETIQQYLARMSTALLAMEAVLFWVAARVDAGIESRREIAEVKVFCAESAWQVIDLALQIFGGMGYMAEAPVSRIWRDARVNLIFDGTSEVNRLLSAKEIIKNLIAGRSALERY